MIDFTLKYSRGKASIVENAANLMSLDIKWRSVGYFKIRIIIFHLTKIQSMFWKLFTFNWGFESRQVGIVDFYVHVQIMKSENSKFSNIWVYLPSAHFYFIYYRTYKVYSLEHFMTGRLIYMAASYFNASVISNIVLRILSAHFIYILI